MQSHLSLRFAAALLAAACPLAAVSASEFRWEQAMAAGRTLEIKGVNGAIEAEPSSSARAEVTAVKSARRSDPSSVRIEVVEHAAGVTICAVYPSDGTPNQCQPGEGGRMNVRDNDVKVNFRVRVPEGVIFQAKTVNGNVRAQGLQAAVHARTVNGAIALSTRGAASARTVNGAITARMGDAAGRDRLEFSTVNGSIRLEFPDAAAADLSASTVNGNIETDFPVTVSGRLSRRSLQGRIGGGGRELVLKTVNGSITLAKASQA